MKDLELDKDYRIGHRGNKVKLIQEWLCLHGLHVVIDKIFGTATDQAVRAFQERQNLHIDGVVGTITFERLIEPMTNALNGISVDEKSLAEMVIAHAEQHLQQHPLEIGGQNKGPWVRLYMNGNEGPDWPWCAGFVSFLLKQACRDLNISVPIRTSFSCDSLAAFAKEKNRFLRGSSVTEESDIKRGYIFLNRRSSTDWIHTGIVIDVKNEFFNTIEGNTNDEGCWEGYEVCQRIRAYKKKDYIIV